MTNPELVTDEIVNKACKGYDAARGLDASHKNKIKAAILAIQDDITRPSDDILLNVKSFSILALAVTDASEKNRLINQALDVIDKALKGEYYETDFTEYCEQNPIMEE
jgi:hypothetical protein